MLNTTLIYIPVQLLPNATAGSSSCVTVTIPDNENLNEESRTQITLALGNSTGVQIADGGGAATVIISDDDGMQSSEFGKRALSQSLFLIHQNVMEFESPVMIISKSNIIISCNIEPLY